MELVLVRHALPVRIDPDASGSVADPGLDEQGHRQAQRLTAALKHESITALYVSPARRALETAAPLAAALELEVQVREGLAEFDAGQPSYVPVEQLRAEGDPRWHALVRGDLTHADIDPEAFRATVVDAVEGIVRQHPGGRVVVVAHSGVLNAYVGHVLRQERPLWFAPAYASLSRVGAARDGRRGVVSLNETGHVRDLLEP